MGSIPQLSIIRGPHRDYTPCQLHKILETNISQWEHATALIFEHDHGTSPIQINYKQFNETANQFARAIIKESTENYSEPNQDGDWVVAVCMQPNEKLLQVLLAIWKAGAAYLPLDPTFPNNRIQHILSEAKPFLVIYDGNSTCPDIFDATPSMDVKDLVKKSGFLQTSNLSNEEALSNYNNDLGLVLYTSGSTGIPKGVRLTHSTILNRLHWQWDTFPYLNSETVCVFKTALTFVDSVCEIWGPLLSGMALLIIPKEVTKDPQRLVHLLEKYSIRRLVLVPTLLRSLLMYLLMNKEKRLLYKLQTWVCSGEILSPHLVHNFYDYFEEGIHAIHNFYGSTEVMGDVTYFSCESRKLLEGFEKVPIGYPVNNTVIYLLDSDYRPVKAGEIGEIFVAGLNLASGYTNERDPHRFLQNPLALDSKYSRLYRTGDFGRVKNSAIIYEGRTDSQIKIRGHRVDLTEIEKNMLTVDIIERAIPLCYHPGEVDQALISFVTLKNRDKAINGLEIESVLKQKFPEYMVPQVIIIENVPLLVNGKVDRQALLKSYENSNNNDDHTKSIKCDYAGIPQELKRVAAELFEIVATVIGRSIRKELTVDSNFYDLGGNSLNSIYTVSLLREKGYNIGISEFISAKTLTEIILKMAETEGNKIMEDNFKHYLDWKLTINALTLHDKQDVINIIASSFYEKADLEQWLKPDISINDYAIILEDIWDTLVEKNLSFIVRDDKGEAVGVTLNFDARDEPEVQINSKLFYVFDFLEFLEGPIRENILPKGLNKILHSFMMGTNGNLNAQQNIAVMTFMENEVLNVAKAKDFVGIFTTNTNPLTQQLGSDVYKYKVMLDYQVNQYVHSDGTRPFHLAPDTQRAIVHWKEINQ